MTKRVCTNYIAVTFLGIGLLCTALGKNAIAHCDTLDGPVVQTARIALEKGDVTALLKWVQADHEKEIRIAFEKTLTVRAKGTAAKELADMYFFETLVRIHRAGEGVPYTGLKPGEAVDPAVALADKALEGGSVDKLVDVLTKAMAMVFVSVLSMLSKRKGMPMNPWRPAVHLSKHTSFSHISWKACTQSSKEVEPTIVRGLQKPIVDTTNRQSADNLINHRPPRCTGCDDGSRRGYSPPQTGFELRGKHYRGRM